MTTNRTPDTHSVPEMSTGWIDLYSAGTAGMSTWSDAAPPFVPALRRFVSPNAEILETCAGDGRISAVLADWSSELSALDLSADALNQLSAKFAARSRRAPRTVIGSATDIPLGDTQFDVVICVDGMCQLDRPRLAMKEAARVLRPGGLFMFDVFTPKDDTFGQGEQIGSQDFLYKGCLFRFFEAEQFEPLFAGLFRQVERFEAAWSDPPHGEFRPQAHNHHANVFVLEKIK